MQLDMDELDIAVSRRRRLFASTAATVSLRRALVNAVPKAKTPRRKNLNPAIDRASVAPFACRLISSHRESTSRDQLFCLPALRLSAQQLV